MQFFASDVTTLCGVKRNRLEVWLKNGWIKPSIQRAYGAGSRNIFDEEDLLSILFFKKSVEAGLPRGDVKGFLDVFSTTQRKLYSLSDWEKMMDPVFIIFLRKDGKVIDTTYERDKVPGLVKSIKAKDADDAIAINISKIMRDILKGIRALER